MPRLCPRHVALAIAVCASAACSQTSNNPTTANGSATASVPAPAADDVSGKGPAPLDCKIFAPSDVASIFTVPTQVSHDALQDGCSFRGADGPFLNINTGGSDDANFSLPWNDVTKSTDSTNFQPLPGVGDQAFFRKKNASEFFSRKGDVYCMVSMTPLDDPDQASGLHIVEQSPEQRAKAIGTLCNKAFAAH